VSGELPVAKIEKKKQDRENAMPQEVVKNSVDRYNIRNANPKRQTFPSVLVSFGTKKQTSSRI
jgi:hypothetical protein